MSKVPEQQRDSVLVSIAIAAISVLFFCQALTIPAETNQFIGSQTVPFYLSLIIAIASLGRVLWFFKHHGVAKIGRLDMTSDWLRYVLPITLTMIIYRFLFEWVGFVLATYVAVLLVLKIYAEKSYRQLLLLPALAAVCAHLIFFQALGVYAPEGRFFDLIVYLGLG